MAAVLTSRIASCSLIVPTLRVRAQLGRPEHLTAIDVADAAHDPLIEQHLTEASRRIGIGEQQVHHGTEVGVSRAEIRPQPAHSGMTSLVDVSIGLDVRRVEAHGHPVGDLDRRPHLRVRTPPVVAGPIQMPRAAHTHVGVEHEPVVPLDHQMLAVTLDGLDDPTRSWRRTDETRGIEPHHRLAGERCTHGAGRSVDRVAFGHRTCMVGPAPGSIAGCSGRSHLAWPNDVSRPSARQYRTADRRCPPTRDPAVHSGDPIRPRARRGDHRVEHADRRCLVDQSSSSSPALRSSQP